MLRPKGTKSARLIQVIETRSKKGQGTENDPARELVQYWDLNGELLAENDMGAKTENKFLKLFGSLMSEYRIEIVVWLSCALFGSYLGSIIFKS